MRLQEEMQMIVKVIPQRKEPEIRTQPWEVEHVVELPPGEFRHFKEIGRASCRERV